MGRRATGANGGVCGCVRRGIEITFANNIAMVPSRERIRTGTSSPFQLMLCAALRPSVVSVKRVWMGL